MKIAIGGDHAGYDLKNTLISHLEKQDYIVDDLGTYTDESTDYPPFSHAVADAVSKGDADFGIVICGSANGVAITANKHRDIRCAICWETELAQLARAHNDANMLALPSRFISEDTALSITNAFLSTDFEGGRHKRRVDKIPCA